MRVCDQNQFVQISKFVTVTVTIGGSFFGNGNTRGRNYMAVGEIAV